MIGGGAAKQARKEIQMETIFNPWVCTLIIVIVAQAFIIYFLLLLVGRMRKVIREIKDEVLAVEKKLRKTEGELKLTELGARIGMRDRD